MIAAGAFDKSGKLSCGAARLIAVEQRCLHNQHALQLGSHSLQLQAARLSI
jgi:hypothetical protein